MTDFADAYMRHTAIMSLMQKWDFAALQWRDIDNQSNKNVP